MGRPTLCTEETIQRAAAAIRGGGTWRDAAVASGIAEATLWEWQAKGHEGAEPYAQFAEAIEKARTALRLEGLGAIREAGKRSWQAWAWILERKWPEDFALVNRLRDETPAENRPSVVAIEADTVRRVLAQYDELDARRQAKGNGQNGQAEAM